LERATRRSSERFVVGVEVLLDGRGGVVGERVSELAAKVEDEGCVVLAVGEVWRDVEARKGWAVSSARWVAASAAWERAITRS